tara:strand:+ start:5885 stop:6310 length:426 start_codon:yes stop_codon:yes gene_type:complete
MEKYKFLEHTADAKFQAFGKTLDEAFSNAALAMFSVMFETDKIKPKVTKKIEVKADNQESLLYNFLEELLFLLDAETFFLHKVIGLKISKANGKFVLFAEVVGDTDLQGYAIHGEVKAVTYNEMFVKKQKEQFVVQVVVDL